MNASPMGESSPKDSSSQPNDFLGNIVRLFLESHLSVILIILSLILRFRRIVDHAAREDPQIVYRLPMSINFPGHTAAEVEQLVASPLERMLYQIDGVEYVYSMSRDDSAIITVRFYVGQDRERSLVSFSRSSMRTPLQFRLVSQDGDDEAG